MTSKTTLFWKLLFLLPFFFMAACSEDDGENDIKPDDDDPVKETEVPEAFLNFTGSSGDNSGAQTVGDPSQDGESLTFNETDEDNGCGQPGGDYIQLPTLGAVWENGFTVAAWVKFTEVRNYERIIDFGNGSGEEGGMNITFSRFAETNDLILTSWINSNSQENRTKGRVNAKDAIKNNEMVFYAGTISPEGEMKIFVNGVKVAEKQDGHPVANVSRSSNFIGHSNWCSEDPDFKGIIDDVQVFNKVLTETEIAAMNE